MSFFYNLCAVKSPVIQVRHEIVSCQISLVSLSVTNENIISETSLVSQLYIDVNKLEDEGRFNILESEDTNSEGFVFFL